ncbi:MAG: ferrous iron transport protein B [Bacillota bacterium]
MDRKRTCHGAGRPVSLVAGARLVLAGNPNVGKSVVFNHLTGNYVDVSNYPGTTVEVLRGRYQSWEVVDTPGIYGVSSFNDEERVAREVILDAGVVLNVVNATHLERDLFLTLQLADMGIPLVVALNMMDEAARAGQHIDVAALEEAIGVPVVPTVAVTGQGLAELEQVIAAARPGRVAPQLQEQLETLSKTAGSRARALLILEDDAPALEAAGLAPGGRRDEIYLERRERVDRLVSACVTRSGGGRSFSARLGRLAVNPLTGLPLLTAVIVAAYYAIGVLAAQTVVDFTEGTLMEGYYVPWIQELVGRFFSETSALGALLAGEFGLLTMTVTYLLGLLLPLVAGFYLIMAILEDSGYLPRVAVLADRALNTVGLNGRAVIPMILGFGCVTVATITTRLLGSRRERTIAVFLLALAIPCSAQLGVIAGLIAPLGARYLVFYLLTVLVVFTVVGTALHRVLPGRPTDLFIDLPPLRLPRPGNIGVKTFNRTWAFIREAGPLFAYGSLAIGVLDLAGLLATIQAAVAPITTGWLGLPPQTANAFIMGVVRRDFGAAGLYDLALSPGQTLTALITITLFVPCIASMLIISKEQGKRQGAVMWAAAFSIAFVVGGVVKHVLALVGW